MNPFNLRHLPLDHSFHVQSKNGETSVIIDYSLDKKIIIKTTLLMVFVPLSLILLFVSSWKVSGVPSVIALPTRLLLIAMVWAGFFCLYFLFYYPLRIQLILRSNEIVVRKRNWFFFTSEYILRKNQRPYLYARQRRMIGASVILGKGAYQPTIRYKENGQEQEINLILTASYFMRGVGPRGVLTKEQIEEIGKQIGLKATFEE